MASYGQKRPFELKIISSQNDTVSQLSGQADSIKFYNLIKTEYQKALKNGFVLADVSEIESDSVFQAQLFTNQKYRWGVFNIDQIPEALLSKIGYRKSQFNHTQINVNELGNLLVKLIEESDYTGYPFAVAKLDSVIITGDHISAKVVYAPGLQIKYGTLLLNTYFVKGHYLESYLDIKKGDLFNSKRISAISKRIDNLPYCKLDSIPIIKFDNKACNVELKISPVKANKLDAMLGLAPNQLDNSKLLATGYVNLELHNLFKSGKRLTFNWRQFGVQSQSLNTSYNHTNLLRSVISLKGEFDLFKQDTTFINRHFFIDIGYDDANYSINIISSFITSRLLSVTSSTSLDDLSLIDFNAQYYGVEFSKNEFDHPVNPRSGWGVKTGINIGSKTILNTSFVPIEMYDSLETQSLQGGINMSSELAVPISKLIIAYSKIEMATLSTNEKLFTNDLYRLGGANSVRGFNELEIYASTYLMLQVEARILLNQNSRIFGFVDWAYATNEVQKISDSYLGLGGGLLLDTPSGVFQLVYAVGNSSKQSLSLAESKIHFGYVARF